MGTLYTKFTYLKALLGFRVDAGGAYIAAGGLTVAAGGLTVAAGGASIADGVSAKELVKLRYLGEITFEATSGEAQALYTLPKDVILTEVICVVSAAFDAGDSNVLTIGAAADADALMASGDIDESAAAAYRKDAWEVGAEGGTAITATYTQAGTAATAGAAKVYARVVESLSD